METPSKPLNRLRKRATITRALAGLTAAAMVPLTMAPAAVAVDKEGPVTVVYVEVNSNDMANVADYTLENSGAPVFDIAMIFAANINYNGESAYLGLNERVTVTLEDAENQIRPLQEMGTKVVLAILGNHQGAGFANFPDQASADAFAQELADIVEKYGLDGIDFDDEWAKYGTNDTGQPNDFSFYYLLSLLREKLGPDKLITLYDLGPAASNTVYNGQQGGDFIDYAWQPYYGAYSAPSIPGLEKHQLAAAAIDLSANSSGTAAALARQTVIDGYGAFVTYNLTSQNQVDYLSAITQELYGENTLFQAPAPEPADTTRPTISVTQVDGLVTVDASDAGNLNRIAANLYTADNKIFLGPIGSTPAKTPLGTTESTQSWWLPADLAGGTYTIRTAASDTAGNVGVATTQVTIGDPQLDVTARVLCSRGDAFVEVSAVNESANAADIRFTLGSATYKVTKVATNTGVVYRFGTGASDVAAGSAAIAAYSWHDGAGHYERYQAPFEALTCGG